MKDQRAPQLHFRGYSNNPNITGLADELIDEMLADRQRLSKADKEEFRKQMIVILTGLQLRGAYRGQDVGIQQDSNLFNASEDKRHPLYQPKTYQCLRFLIEDGRYLEKVSNHFNDPEGKRSRPATYRATYRLLSKAMKYPPPPLSTIVLNPDTPLVELRNNDKRIIRLPKSQQRAELRKWTQQIRRFNERISLHHFAYGEDGEAQSPASFSLRRIFSQGSFDKGGRFYADFQSWSSDQRQWLRIDGEPVVEIDYRFLHPSLLYAWEGIDIEDDPYTIDGYDRGLVKVAFNVLINRDDPNGCWQGISYYTGLKKENAQDLEAAIRERMQPIAKYFGTGIGLGLQRYDSSLTEGIIGYFLDHSDNVVLPIHDSYVARCKDLQLLRAALIHAETYAATIHNKPPRQPLLKATYYANDERVAAQVRSVFGDEVVESSVSAVAAPSNPRTPGMFSFDDSFDDAPDA